MLLTEFFIICRVHEHQRLHETARKGIAPGRGRRRESILIIEPESSGADDDVFDEKRGDDLSLGIGYSRAFVDRPIPCFLCQFPEIQHFEPSSEGALPPPSKLRLLAGTSPRRFGRPLKPLR